MVDNFEFVQLLSCHFILLSGMVYFGSQRTLDIASTCDGVNGTTVSVACTYEATRIDYTKLYQGYASAAILICLLATIIFGGITLWVQAHDVIKQKLHSNQDLDVDPKFTSLMDLAADVMAKEVRHAHACSHPPRPQLASS